MFQRKSAAKKLPSPIVPNRGLTSAVRGMLHMRPAAGSMLAVKNPGNALPLHRNSSPETSALAPLVVLGIASASVGGVGMGVLEPGQRLSRRSMPMGMTSLSAEEPSLPSRKSSDRESPPPPRRPEFGKRMSLAGALPPLSQRNTSTPNSGERSSLPSRVPRPPAAPAGRGGPRAAMAVGAEAEGADSERRAALRHAQTQMEACEISLGRLFAKLQSCVRPCSHPNTHTSSVQLQVRGLVPVKWDGHHNPTHLSTPLPPPSPRACSTAATCAGLGPSSGGAPTIIPSRDVSTFSESEEAATYSADLVREMRMGHIAVQVFAADDVVHAPGAGGDATDLWTADPWALLHTCLPELVRRVRRRIKRKNDIDGGGAAHAETWKLGRGRAGSDTGSKIPGCWASGAPGTPQTPHNQTATPPIPAPPTEPSTHHPARSLPAHQPLPAHELRASLGARALCQLAIGVAAIAGPEAVRATPLILHVSDGQQEQAVSELWQHKFFGCERRTLPALLTPLSAGMGSSAPRCCCWCSGAAPATPGTRPHSATGAGVRRRRRGGDGGGGGGGCEGQQQTPGSGHCLLQMGYPGEAQVVGEDGLARAMLGTTFEAMTDWGVEYLLIRSAKDLSLYTSRGVFDELRLSHMMRTRATTRAVVMMEVASTRSAARAKAQDSLVVWNRSPDSLGAVNGPQFVCELRHCEFSNQRLADALKLVDIKMAGQLFVGLGRYNCHLPSIKTLLGTTAELQPRLQLDLRARVHVRLDMTHIMRCNGGRTVAVEGDDGAGWVSSYQDLVELVNIVQSHESSAEMKALLSGGSSPTTPRPQTLLHQRSLAMASSRRASQTLQIAVFIADNGPVSVTALVLAKALARPERDGIAVVLAVASEAQRATGQALLDSVLKAAAAVAASEAGPSAAAALAVAVGTEVIVRGPEGSVAKCGGVSVGVRGAGPPPQVRGDVSLVGCLESYVASTRADLVVMGSRQLTAHVADFTVGSVSLGLLRRSTAPLVVVTSHCSKAVERLLAQGRHMGPTVRVPPFGPPVPSRTGTSVSCLALAEPHSSPLVAFLSGRLLSPARGDRLSVGLPTAAAASRAQQQASRRFLAALQEGILGERGRVDTRGEGGGGRRVTRAACHPTLGAHARTCVTAVHGTRELDPGLPRSLAHAPWQAALPTMAVQPVDAAQQAPSLLAAAARMKACMVAVQLPNAMTAAGRAALPATVLQLLRSSPLPIFLHPAVAVRL
ncbi:MAG: hypothetical protein WDW38_000415 [Sanguina aurantia]